MFDGGIPGASGNPDAPIKGSGTERIDPDISGNPDVVRRIPARPGKNQDFQPNQPIPHVEPSDGFPDLFKPTNVANGSAGDTNQTGSISPTKPNSSTPPVPVGRQQKIRNQDLRNPFGLPEKTFFQKLKEPYTGRHWLRNMLITGGIISLVGCVIGSALLNRDSEEKPDDDNNPNRPSTGLPEAATSPWNIIAAGPITSSATPSATMTLFPSLTLSPTPSASATERATATPSATKTPTPSNTPEATVTQYPSPTMNAQTQESLGTLQAQMTATAAETSEIVVLPTDSDHLIAAENLNYSKQTWGSLLEKLKTDIAIENYKWVVELNKLLPLPWQYSEQNEIRKYFANPGQGIRFQTNIKEGEYYVVIERFNKTNGEKTTIEQGTQWIGCEPDEENPDCNVPIQALLNNNSERLSDYVFVAKLYIGEGEEREDEDIQGTEIFEVEILQEQQKPTETEVPIVPNDDDTGEQTPSHDEEGDPHHDEEGDQTPSHDEEGDQPVNLTTLNYAKKMFTNSSDQDKNSDIKNMWERKREKTRFKGKDQFRGGVKNNHGRTFVR